MAAEYSTVQKLALAAFFVAAILSATGGLAPYWIVAEPTAPGSLGVFLKVASSVLEGYMGLFMACFETPLGKGCEIWRTPGEQSSWVTSARICGIICIVLGIVCGLSALCLACCRCCERLIVLGILAAVSAACGGFAAGAFGRNMNIFTSTVAGFSFASWGWAFYVFCCGAGLMALAALAALFAAPSKPQNSGGIVLSAPQQQQQPQIIQVSSSQNSAMCS